MPQLLSALHEEGQAAAPPPPPAAIKPSSSAAHGQVGEGGMRLWQALTMTMRFSCPMTWLFSSTMSTCHIQSMQRTTSSRPGHHHDTSAAADAPEATFPSLTSSSAESPPSGTTAGMVIGVRPVIRTGTAKLAARHGQPVLRISATFSRAGKAHLE